METTVNTKLDAGGYDRSCYQREIFDANVLYESYHKAKKGSDWKPQVQNFEIAWLLPLAKMQEELQNRTYEFLPTSKFIIHERGHTRIVEGEQIPDRIVEHALCDEVLNPTLRKFLIYDNSASLTDRGIDFARRRLETHLHKFYMETGSNDGYIALYDFSKYYDNLIHEVLYNQFKQYVDDETALWLIKKVLDRAKVDVSYMSWEEYEDCMNLLFNSLEYAKIDKSLLTGEKFMKKHLEIGRQLSQTAGILYPTPIDNYVKIVRGMKYYGRYMDDGYIIHQSKESLQKLLTDIGKIAKSIGIMMNLKKTRIVKLSDFWRFLQIQYSLTDTGRVVHKINPKQLTAMRRKMKKLAPRMTEREFSIWYRSWFRNHYKNMSRKQRENMDTLFAQLKEVCLCTP